MIKGLVTEIQRYSTHEGPGIRTTVFFKGCQLSCPWCHNPETISIDKELMFYPERCIGCLACRDACPKSLHTFSNGNHTIDFQNCNVCGKCADVCWSGALRICGKHITVSDVMEEVEEDRVFYGKEGGVTLSGGEPLLQPEFTLSILKECKKRNINTAIETNLSFPFAEIEKVLPYTDLFICDIKIMDTEKHRQYTGMDNALLFENIKHLDEADKQLIVRTPLISGVNDTRKNAEETAEFLFTIGNLLYYEVLPYHALGLSKSDALGRPRAVFESPSKDSINSYIEIVRSFNVRTVKGGII